MKTFTRTMRTALLLAALAVTGLALAPGQAEAEKSCFYYCGQPGYVSCPLAPASLSCTYGFPPP